MFKHRRLNKKRNSKYRKSKKSDSNTEPKTGSDRSMTSAVFPLQYNEDIQKGYQITVTILRINRADGRKKYSDVALINFKLRDREIFEDINKVLAYHSLVAVDFVHYIAPKGERVKITKQNEDVLYELCVSNKSSTVAVYFNDEGFENY